MATKKFLVDLDLVGNKLLNAGLEHHDVSVQDGLVQGQIVYDTVSNNVFTWDGSAWKQVGNDVADIFGQVSGDVLIDASGVAEIQSGKVGSIELADDAVVTAKILDAAVTEDKLATDAVTTIKILANNVTNAKLAEMGPNTLKGNNTGASTDPIDLSAAQVKTMLGIDSAGGEMNTAATVSVENVTSSNLSIKTAVASVAGGGTSLDSTIALPAAIPVDQVGTPAGAAGLMTGADKKKLDDLESAPDTGDLNLGVSQPADTVAPFGETPVTITLTDGDSLNQSIDIDIATADTAGLITGASWTKLEGIEAGANYIDPTTLVYDTVALNGGDLVTNIDWIKNDTGLAGDSDTEVSTTKAVKAYVDAAISSLGAFKGGYDADADTTDGGDSLDGDSGTIVSGILEGDYYAITKAGTFFTTAVTAGDTIIAKQVDPITEAGWTIVVKQVGYATTTVQGEVILAVPADVISNESSSNQNNLDVVTPEGLHQTLSAETMAGSAIGNARRYSETFTVAATQFTAAHGLGHKFVEVKVYDATGDEVITGVKVNQTSPFDVVVDTNFSINNITIVVVG